MIMTSQFVSMILNKETNSLTQQQLNRQHCGYLLDVSTKQEIWIFGKERWQENYTDDNSWISSITSCHQLSHNHHQQVGRVCTEN